jgi:hypothetical protein
VCTLAFGQQAQQQTPPDQTQTQPPSQTPPPPAPPQKYDPAETPFSFGFFGFLAHAHPDLLPGKGATVPAAETFKDLGKTRYAAGIRLAIPTGKGNYLEFSGWQLKGTGGHTVPIATTIFGSTYAANDVISDRYKVRNIKISWNYLSYPAPPGNRKFRFKTLYEVQYTSFTSNFSSSSEASLISSQGSHNIIYPMFGVAAGYVSSKNFYIETKASAFAFPHRSTVWDAEANAVIRSGHFEVALGGKAFHFRTTPQKEEYFRSTLYAPMVSLRYVFK